MIDGIWWLVIFVAVIGALWLLAHRRGGKINSSKGNTEKSNINKSGINKSGTGKSKTKGATTKPPNDALQKTANILKKHFADYRVIRREGHLLLTEQGKRIAMITIDKKRAAGQRRLGEVPIINYHRVPSRAQLSSSLSVKVHNNINDKISAKTNDKLSKDNAADFENDEQDK